MAVKLDVSHHSVVVYCDECPSWIVLTSSRTEGHATANRHERNVHPDQAQAAAAASIYASRHADR